MKKHILIISGRDTSVEMLKDLPIKITLFQTPNRVTDLQQQLADRVITMDLDNNFEEMKNIAQTIHSIDPFDAAVSFIEDFLLLTAELVEKFGINGNPLKPVQITRNKLKMRKHLASFDIPTIRHMKCSTLEDVKDFFKEINAPIILKPSNGAGSLNISLIQSKEDISEAWGRTSDQDNEVIAEEYIDGKEFSVEAITVDGKHEILAITEKETTGSPYFIETGHRQPAQLDESIQDAMKNVTRDFLNCIEHQEGPTHTEIKLREGVPYIIEGHTRYGGDRIWELLYLTTGIHIQQTTVCNLLGLLPPINPKNYDAAAVKFISSQPKELTYISGVEEAKGTDGIHSINISIEPGQNIQPLVNSNNRLGYIIGGAGNLENAWKNILLAEKSINFV